MQTSRFFLQWMLVNICKSRAPTVRTKPLSIVLAWPFVTKGYFRQGHATITKSRTNACIFLANLNGFGTRSITWLAIAKSQQRSEISKHLHG